MESASTDLHEEFAAPVLAALEVHEATAGLLTKTPALKAAAAKVAISSDFAGRLLLRHPAWLA
ncbi:MAG: hypothetical protein JJU27_16020, partial [Gammaproteobacteria bacterium]|nr:hypothetical protein [Gammaproteobacteria bacterium]